MDQALNAISAVGFAIVMWGGDNVWEWLQKILFPKGKKNKKDKKKGDK